LAALTPGLSAGALGNFYYQLAALLKAGLPIMQALRTLEEQAVSRRIRRRLPETARRIEAGGGLGNALAGFDGLFPAVHTAMLSAAEAGGRLTETLETLSELSRRRSRLLKKVITGVAYPVFLLHFAVFVLPIIERIQNPDVSYWGLVFRRLGLMYGLLAAAVVVPRLVRSRPAGAYALDWLKGLIPVWSGVTEKLALARLARSLDGLYSAGMPLAAALSNAADACGN
jgi:type II secretory pathway component PulF